MKLSETDALEVLLLAKRILEITQKEKYESCEPYDQIDKASACATAIIDTLES